MMDDDEQQGSLLRRQLDDELAGLQATVAAQESLRRRIADVTPGHSRRGHRHSGGRSAVVGRNATRPGRRSALAIPLAAIAVVTVIAIATVIGTSARHAGRQGDGGPAAPRPTVSSTVAPTPPTPKPDPTMKATEAPGVAASPGRVPSAGVPAGTIRPSSPAVTPTASTSPVWPSR